MNTLTISLIISFINTVVLVVIFYYLYLQYDEKAMGTWSLSWLVYSFRFVFMLLAGQFGGRAFFTVGHDISSLVSAFILLYGLYQYSGEKMRAWWGVGCAVCIAWTFTQFAAITGFLMYALPISLYTAAIFFRTGLAYLRMPRPRSYGSIITGIAFLVWAFHKLNYPFLRPMDWFVPWGYFISSTLLILVAAGILTGYFEKVRNRLLANEKSLDEALLDSLRRETQITLLLEGARTILENRAFGETARTIFESCRRYTGATAGYVALLSANGLNSEIIYLYPEEVPGTASASSLVQVRGLLAEAFASGRVMYENFPEGAENSGYLPVGHTALENVLISPLVVGGKTVGGIVLVNRKGGFIEEDAQITRAFADLASIALMNSMSLEMLEKSENRFRTLVESMNDVVFTLDRELRHTGLYGSWVEHYSIEEHAFLGRKAVEVLGVEAGTIHEQMALRALCGENVTYDWSLAGSHFQTSLSPIRDALGNITGVVGVGRDITLLKETEARLDASLREKELLLKEVHHRVKNNMQIISSLINLQSQLIGDKEHRDIFSETSARVRTMALVHEKLYQSENFAKINFREYLHELVAGLISMYKRDGVNVDLIIRVEDIEIGIDRAIPCAQIVNELVSNSLKYAFGPGDKGVIEISFGKTDQGKYSLFVADNGRGLPEGLDIEKVKTLGLQLVAGLVKQLKGDLSIERGAGVKFFVLFE